MTAELREKISALTDGELERAEAEALLQRLLQDDALHHEWERYHLIGDLMHGEIALVDASGVAEQVRERLADEPPIVAAARPSNVEPRVPLRTAVSRARHWVLPAASAAVAASLTTAVVLLGPGVGVDINGGEANGGLAMEQTVPETAMPRVAASEPAVRTVSLSGTGWKNLDQGSAVESKLNDYLVDHGEFASPMGVGRGGPFATFVSYDGK